MTIKKISITFEACIVKVLSFPIIISPFFRGGAPFVEYTIAHVLSFVNTFLSKNDNFFIFYIKLGERNNNVLTETRKYNKMKIDLLLIRTKRLRKGKIRLFLACRPRKAVALLRPSRQKFLVFFSFSGAKQFCKERFSAVGRSRETQTYRRMSRLWGKTQTKIAFQNRFVLTDSKSTLKVFNYV